MITTVPRMKRVQYEIKNIRRTNSAPLFERGPPPPKKKHYWPSIDLLRNFVFLSPRQLHNHCWAGGRANGSHHISPKHKRLITCSFSDKGIIEEGLKLVFRVEKKKETGRKSRYASPRVRLINHKRKMLQKGHLSNEKSVPCKNAHSYLLDTSQT